MGKFFKDSYASTYAAKNVKEALDKLIDVLQSPAQVRKLVIGSCAGPRKSSLKVPGSKLSFESPANSPASMPHLCTEMKKKPPRNGNKGDAGDAPPPDGNSTERKKTMTTPSSSGSGSGSGSANLECGEPNSDHIPVGRFTQLWRKSLRDYPLGGSDVVARTARERHQGSPRESGWTSAPCKSGDFAFVC